MLPSFLGSPFIHVFLPRWRETWIWDAMVPPTDGISNWMHLFRWIVKLIRDDYGVDEGQLVRGAVLDADCGLQIEDIETVLKIIATGFAVRFPPGTLDEVVKLDELCMLTAWLKGLYKRPEFISDQFAADCQGLNPACA